MSLDYVSHPISSDNDVISQKLLLKSEFYYSLHVAMGVAYLCFKIWSFYHNLNLCYTNLYTTLRESMAAIIAFLTNFCLGVELEMQCVSLEIYIRG